ncbi:endo-1,4-beta-xylanase [bacterium]
MKRIFFFLLTFFYCAHFYYLSAQTVPEPSGRRLREIVEDKYSDNSIIIGGTTGAWAFSTNTGLIMDREFNYVTPENDFKQWAIHSSPTSWNWTQADRWIDHIYDNNQILRMHCPIGPQCSSWAQTDSRTAEELEQLMWEFMDAVCDHYNGTEGIVSMDVVNETVQGGAWKKDEPGTGGWEMPWYKIGLDTDAKKTPLYIRYAFESANEYAPDLKLIYNHHEDPNSVSSWNLIKTTIGYLRDLGFRVDGIGWQAHVNNGWATTTSLNRLRDLIDWAHENALEFHVTEASVWINGEHTESAFQTQAETYRKIVEVLLEKRFNGKVGWNTWHIDDGHGWNNDKAPSLFDENYEAKPAYYAIQEALENASTGITVSSDMVSNSFKLYDNYPNPFNPTTNIRYSVVITTEVTLKVYDVLGKEIETLVNHVQVPGQYTITFDGSNITCGPYFYRLRAGNFTATKKLMLLK